MFVGVCLSFLILDTRLLTRVIYKGDFGGMFSQHNSPQIATSVCYTFFMTFRPTNETRVTAYMDAPAMRTTPVQILTYMYPPSSRAMKAPAMGLLTSAGMASIPNCIPFRSPISRMGEICAISAGHKVTKAPEPNPYRAANTMMAALPEAGSHRANTMMPEKKAMMVWELYAPSLSAAIPGSMRPNRLFYCQRCSDLPSSIMLHRSASPCCIQNWDKILCQLR